MRFSTVNHPEEGNFNVVAQKTNQQNILNPDLIILGECVSASSQFILPTIQQSTSILTFNIYQ